MIVGRLSGRHVIYKRRWWGWRYYFKEFFRIVIHRQWLDWNDFLHPYERVLLSVGSILRYVNNSSIVWGSGFMNESDTLIGRSPKIYAVRGYLTANKLFVNGLPRVGDPALLMPLLVPIDKKLYKRYEIGIIPHWSEFERFSHNIYAHISPEIKGRCLLIDFRTTDIYKVLNDIWECKLIVSSSLHGLILSHAYHIPAIWIRDTSCGTDGFKFYDYFSSVKIQPYEGFKANQKLFSSLENIQNLFIGNSDKALPNEDVIKGVQSDLLDTFPY